MGGELPGAVARSNNLRYGIHNLLSVFVNGRQKNARDS
jgi:hypothetical protein